MALRFRQAAQWDDWRGHHYRAAIESGHEPLGVIEGQGSRSSGMTLYRPAR